MDQKSCTTIVSPDPRKSLSSRESHPGVIPDDPGLKLLIGGSQFASPSSLALSAQSLQRIDVGFEHERLLSVEIPLDRGTYQTAMTNHQFFERLGAEVAGLPGVTHATIARHRPLAGLVGDDWGYVKEGQPLADAQRNEAVNLQVVGTNYFETTGIRVQKGRGFLATDTERTPGVAVIGELLAMQGWPGEDPLGKRLEIPVVGSPDLLTLTIVGVVDNVRHRTLTTPTADLYVALPQVPFTAQFLLVRSNTSPLGLGPAVRDIVRQLDPNQAIGEVVALETTVDRASVTQRLLALIVALLAGIATVLAVVSVYGSVSRSVAQRSREIGLRRALGATDLQLWWLIARQGISVSAAGLATGVAALLASSRLVSSIQYEAQSLPTWLHLTIAGALALAILAAMTIPLSRAIRLDASPLLRSST